MLGGGGVRRQVIGRRPAVILTAAVIMMVVVPLMGLTIRNLSGPRPASPPQTRQRHGLTAPVVTSIGALPRRLVVSGTTVWVLTWNDTVVGVQARTGRLLGAPIPVGFASWDLAVGGGALWVSANGGTTVVRIDPRARRIVAVIDLGMPVQLVAAGAGSVWAISDVRDLALQIDPASNRVTGRPVRVGDQPTAAVVAFGALWVASHDQGLVSRVDLRSGQVTNVPDPWSIHFLAAGAGRVWASHYHDGTVTRIDPVRNRVLGRPIMLPFAPGALAAGPDAVWVMQASPDNPGGSTQLARLDPRSGTVLQVRQLTGLAAVSYGAGTLWVGRAPGSVSHLPAGSR
jgi:DNA-binding beta-propeller fold protein YncE